MKETAVLGYIYIDEHLNWSHQIKHVNNKIAKN